MQKHRPKLIWLIIGLVWTIQNGFAAYSTEEKRLQGSIIDAETSFSIPFASVFIQEINLRTTSDADGKFTISTNYEGPLKIIISYVGYETLNRTLQFPVKEERLTFIMQPSNYALQEVVVSAKEGTKGNSVSLIEKEAMKHIQPSGFADLLQLLPGHSTKEIDMSNSTFISMRQTANSGIDINTSLGTSFIVDGATISNDANMQSVYGLSSTDPLAGRISTSKGIDMRTISTDKIESVEIVRGIPSAQYGDLTAGMVKIELKTGTTPWEGRVKTDLKNKLFSVGKGFILPNNKGAVNVDADYLMYNTDPRSDLTTYTRTTFSGRYKNTFKLSEKVNFLLRGNMSYTGSFDDEKKDPSSLSSEDYLKTEYNNLQLSSGGTFDFKNSVVNQLNYNVSFAQTKEKTDRVKLLSLGGTVPLTTVSTEEGSFETGYLPAEYPSRLIMEGKPQTFEVKINAKSELKYSNFYHSLIYGGEFSSSKNKGKGEIYDLNYPPFPTSKNTRPRPFKEIPALYKISLFIEDDINWKLGNSKLLLQPGIRVSSMPGLNSRYKMKGKYYWEPRFNMKFTFPQFEIAGQQSSFALTGGMAQLYRLPTMAHLYPNNIYFDYIELNYYSLNSDYRYAQIRTYIEDPTNYNIEPAKNQKYEIGFVFVMKNKKLNLTFFREIMDNGFSSGTDFVFHDYRYYEASSIPNPTHKPSLDEFNYTDQRVSNTYYKTINNAGVYKTGIEYTLDFGKIDPIYTRIWMNGACFWTHYKYNGNRYYHPTVTYDQPYHPYIGIYNYSKENRRYTQFNTNIYFDTHIPFLKMIFTTSLQNMWFESRQEDYYSGLPIAYMDATGKVYEFKKELIESDSKLKDLVENTNEYNFMKNKIPIASVLNLKLSKEIGDKIMLGCYFNNLLTFLPDYTNVRGQRVMNRNRDPYFGAELNIRF